MTTKEERTTPEVEEMSPADKAHIARDAREARIRQLLRDDDELLGKAYDLSLIHI